MPQPRPGRIDQMLPTYYGETDKRHEVTTAALISIARSLHAIELLLDAIVARDETVEERHERHAREERTT